MSGAGLFLAALLAIVPNQPQAVRVAAAADLQLALPELATRFERATGVKVLPTFGSSGNLATQIENGAPFDVFLSADVEYPRRLATRGLADRSAVVSYARGRIVLWTRNDSGVALDAGLKGLLASAVRRLAIANPDHAPYGRAAVAALRHEGLYESLRHRLILGENISQTAQFARSGNADAAIIALSLAVGPALREVGRYLEIPPEFHPTIEQGAVWMSRSPNSAVAKQFVEFLLQPDSTAYLHTMGFEPIGGVR